MRVHLFPSSGPISSSHFLKTIVNYEENCKTDTLLNFINDSSIKNSLRNESYPCWGVTNGDKDRNIVHGTHRICSYPIWNSTPTLRDLSKST